MKRFTGRPWVWLAAFAALAFVSAAIACATVWSGCKACEAVFGQTVAAWAQAIGSGVAIYAAYRIGNNQITSAIALEEHKQRTTQERRFKALLTLCESMQSQIDATWQTLDRVARHGLDAGEFRHHDWGQLTRAFVGGWGIGRHLLPLQRYLETIDPLEYGNAAGQVVELNTAMQDLASAYEEVKASLVPVTLHEEGDTFPGVSQPVGRFMARSQRSMQRLAAACMAVGVHVPTWTESALSRES